MQAHADPNPFPSAQGCNIVVQGGTPPYTYEPAPSPPNPPGVYVDSAGHLSVPPGTPPDTTVSVIVYDSSKPPQSVQVTTQTA